MYIKPTSWNFNASIVPTESFHSFERFLARLSELIHLERSTHESDVVCVRGVGECEPSLDTCNEM